VQNGTKIDWDRESTGEPSKGSTQSGRDSWVTGLTSRAVKWSRCKMGLLLKVCVQLVSVPVKLSVLPQKVKN